MVALTRAKASKQHSGTSGRRNNATQHIILSATEGGETHHCTIRHHFRLCVLSYLLVR